eukprot:jgi/Botrbrau1/9627/Bobra.0131s0007.1
MGRLKSRLDTFTALYRLAQQPGYPRVKSLEVAQKLGLLHFQKAKEKQTTPRKIVFPEDRLLQAFYAKRPEFLEEPVDLNSFSPPFARKFAWRQLELMEAGMTRKAAERLTEREFKDELESKSFKSSMIKKVQAEEERAILAALQDAEKL